MDKVTMSVQEMAMQMGISLSKAVCSGIVNL